MAQQWNAEKWITPADLDRSRTATDLEGLHYAASELTKASVNRFLDIGCGFGGLARLVGDYIEAKEVYGVDIDPRVIEEAAKKDVSVVLQDVSANPLPFPDGHFDVVMTLGMMDYLTYFDELIREINRVTVLGGLVLVSLPNLASWHNRISLLLGYQPRDVEFSSEILAGVPRRLYTDRGEGPAGHIHIPTARAFVELMEYHGFETVQLLSGRPQARTTSNPILLAIDRLMVHRPTMSRRFYYIGRRMRTIVRPERSAHMPYECL